MPISSEWEKMILQHVFKRAASISNLGGGGLPASTNSLWFSLHTGGTDSHTTALSNEISGGNYARAELATDLNINTHVQWNSITSPATGQQRITNKADIVFPTASAAWNAGAAISLAGMWTVASSGNAEQFLGLAFFVGSVVILAGNTLRFQGGSPGNMMFTVI